MFLSESHMIIACMHSIKSKPNSLRPREKIAISGVETVTTLELMMLILASGSKRFPVQKLAKKVLLAIEKKHCSFQELRSIPGIGVAKAAQVLAALELSSRLFPSPSLAKIDTVKSVLNQVSELSWLEKEHVVGLYLDSRLQLVHKEIICIGSLNQASLSPRDVFSVIKKHPVLSVILVHNHPSGDPTPSADDIRWTNQLLQASMIMGVELLDHIIVARENHYSFKQDGKL